MPRLHTPLNLPIVTFKTIVKPQNSNTSAVNDVPQTSDPFRSLEFRSAADLVLTWDLENIDDRVTTFEYFQNKDKFKDLNLSRLARIGFYYLIHPDIVKCIYCEQEFNHYFFDEEILERHRKTTCQFSNASQDCRIIELYPDVLFIEENDKRQLKHFLNFHLHPVKTPKNKEFISYEARLKTFDKLLRNMTQSIHSFCKAGFFYSGCGISDNMKCFCCNKNLEDWKDNDDPWIEHARWSPQCSFVLLTKGKYYVEASILNNKRNLPHISPEGYSMMMADRAYCTNPVILGIRETEQMVNTDNNTTPWLSLRYFRELQDTDLKIPDSLLCKICFTEAIKLVFIPCLHAAACVECALTLEQCPICRTPYNSALRIKLCFTCPKDLHKLPSSSASQNTDISVTCLICRQGRMEVAFAPCGHVCACLKCADEIENCPLCSYKFYGYTQIYI